MAEDILNLDTSTPTPDNTLNLDTGQTVNVSPEVAELRAQKAAHAGVGDVTSIRQSILAGQEMNMREALSNQVDQYKLTNAAKLINQGFDPGIFKPSDPKSIFEEKYAEKVMDGFKKGDDNFGGTYVQMSSADPDGATKAAVAGQQTLAWVEWLKARNEEAKQQKQDQGWLDFGLDTAKSFIPGFTSLRLSTVPGGTFLESPLPGDKLDNLQQAVAAEPNFGKRKAMAEAIANSLNPGMKEEFYNYLLHPNSYKQVLDNTLSALDFWIIGEGAAKGIQFGLKTTEKLAIRNEFRRIKSEAIETMAKEADHAPIPRVVSDAVGLPQDAGKIGFEQHILNQLKPAADPAIEMMDGASTVMKTGVNDIVKGGTAGNLGGEALNRLVKGWNDSSSGFLGVLGKIVNPQRIGDVLKDPVVLKAAIDEQLAKYPGLSGNVLNTMGVRWDNIGKRWVMDHILGENTAKFFESPAEAMRFAQANNIGITNIHGHPQGNIKIKGAKTGSDINFVEGLDKGIYSQGKGYYLAISMPLDETLSTIRQAVVKTDAAVQKNNGWLNQMGLGFLRTADEVLSEQDIANRKVAIFSSGLLKEAIAATLKPVGKAFRTNRNWKPTGKNLSKIYNNFGKNTDFERLLKYGQDNHVEFKDIPSLQDWYIRTIGRTANEAEVAGYFAYRQGLAMDYIKRNLALVSNMSRLGSEQHSFMIKGADGLAKPSLSFTGFPIDSETRSTYNVLVQTEDGFKQKRLQNLSNKERESIKKGETKLIKLYSPSSFDASFAGDSFKNQRFNYVIGRNMQSKPLDFLQLPRKEGGHLEYDYGWYVKKPEIVENSYPGQDTYYHYHGDKTIAAADSHFLAKGNAEALNAVQDAMKVGDVNRAQILAREVKGATWAEVKAMMDRYGTSQKFYAVPRGKTIHDVENDFSKYGNFLRDTSRDGSSPDKQFAVEFTGERDAYDVFAFHNDGTVGNPSFAYRPAEFIDPVASLSRAVTRIANSSFMDDIKISSIESWLARYKGQIDDKWAKELYNNPWRSFVNAPLKSGLPANVRNQIESERLQIKMFSRIPTKWDTALSGVQQFLEDAVYGAKNPVIRAPIAATKFAFDTAMEAPNFLRKVTYRADIGLFSVPQLLVQSNTYVTIAGISGFKKAGQGTAAAMLHQYSRLPNVSENILNRLDRIAQSTGWRPGEWKEARDTMLNRTGFHQVGKETNLTMEGADGYKMVPTAMGSILDAGDIFFKEGERNARFGAWYTAFKEFRDASPTGRLSNTDIASIVNRADLLSGNMTAASRSAIQMGPLAFPTQFIGYSLRIMEQFTGKRLTALEKARLFGVYGAVYGLPFTTGLFSVIPFTQRIREYAMEHGYIEKESDIADAAFNGIPSLIMQHITGTTYNVGPRYGNLDVLQNILAPDKTWWDALGGATLNTAENLWTSAVPFWKMGVGFVKGEPNLIKPTTADFMAPLKTFASGNSALRLLAAINTGDWLSRNEGLLARNVGLTQAAFMTATGLSPIEVDKIQLRNLQKTNWEDDWKRAENLFIKDYRRFLRDVSQKNYNAAREHWNNSQLYLVMANYPIQRRSTLFAQANQNQTIPEAELIKATFGKDVPAGYEQYRQMLYAREQQVRRQFNGPT